MNKRSFSSKVLSALLAIIMIITTVPATVFANDNPIMENYASGKDVKLLDITGNTELNYLYKDWGDLVSYNPINVTDGNPDTGTVAVGVYQWQAQIDLGEVKENVNTVKVTFPNDANNNAPLKFTISVSEDGTAWEQVVEHEFPSVSEKESEATVTFDNKNARYIRVADALAEEYNMAGNQIQMVLNEVEVYSDPALIAPALENFAFEKEVKLFDITGTQELRHMRHDWGYPVDQEYKPANITDGDVATGTIAAGVYQWQAQIDLGEVKTDINTVKVTFPEDTDSLAPLNFTVSVSEDGTEWEQVAQKEFASIAEKESEVTLTFANKDAQYIRVADALAQEFNSAGTQIQMQLNEVEVYADPEVDIQEQPPAGTLVNFALNKEVKLFDITGTQELGYPRQDWGSPADQEFKPTNATDGDPATGTSGAGVYQWQAQIDLGEVKTDINKVKVTFPSDTNNLAPLKFTVSVSENGTEWEQVVQKEFASVAEKESEATVTFNRVDARYIRVADALAEEYNDAGTQIQMQLNEVEVYSDPDVADVPDGPVVPGPNPDDPVMENFALNKGVKLLDITGTQELGYLRQDWGSPADQEFKPANATDGDPATGTVGTGVYQWQAQIDLGEVKTDVNTVKVTFPSDADTYAPLKFTVSVSENGTEWEQVAQKEFASVAEKESEATVTFENKNARYIRVADALAEEYNAAGTQIQMQLNEVEVYSDPDLIAPPPPGGDLVNYALGGKAEFLDKNGVEVPSFPGYDVSQTVDGRMDTRGGGAGGRTGYDLIVTLTERTEINKVRVYFAPESELCEPDAYEIMVSATASGENWRLVGSGTSDDFYHEATFPIRKVKRIKVVDRGRANQECVGVVELEAYLDPEFITEADKKVDFIDENSTAKMFLTDKSGNELAYLDNAPVNAIDESKDTYAQPSAQISWMLEVDMQEIKENVNEIEIDFVNEEGAIPDKYVVQSSTDGKLWRTISTITSKNASEALTFYPFNMRYIRIVDTSESESSMKVSEVRAFSTEDIIYEEDRQLITDIYPADGYRNVAIGEPTYVFFNQPLSKANLLQTSLYYVNVAGDMEAALYQLDSTGTMLKITPKFGMSYATPYSMIIQNKKIGIEKYKAPQYTTVLSKDYMGELLNVETMSFVDVAGNPLEASLGRDAYLANDGDFTTVASADSQEPWALIADLGSVQTNVNNISLHFGSANSAPVWTPSNYKIMSSIDGETWETVKVIAPHSSDMIVDFVRRTARFIKIELVAGQMAIAELEIYKNDTPSGQLLNINGVSPKNSSTNIALDTNIVVTFNKSVYDDFDVSGVVVKDPDGNVVEFTHSFDASSSILTLNPVQDLVLNTKYTVSFDTEKLGLDVEFAPITFKTTKGDVQEVNIITPDMQVKLFDKTGGREVPYIWGDWGYPHDEVYKPSNAIDGDLSTGTSAVTVYTWMLQIDMGEIKSNISEVVIDFLGNETQDAVPSEFDVLVSQNGMNWTTVAQVRESVETKQANNRIGFDSIDARYIAVRSLVEAETGKFGLFAMTINEVQAYQDLNAPPRPLAVDKITPFDGTSNFDVNSPIVISFNKAIDDAARIADAVAVKDEMGNRITCVSEFTDSSNRAVSIMPSTSWDMETEYTVTFDNIAMGVPTIQPITFSTTIAPSAKENQLAGASALLLNPLVTGEYDDGSVLPPSGGNVAEYALDDSLATFACAANSYQWQLHLDMQEVKEDINEVRIRFGNPSIGVDGTPLRFEIYSSIDGVSYDLLKTVEFKSVAAKPSYVKVVFDDPVDMRYLRIKDGLAAEYNVSGSQIQMSVADIVAYAFDENDPVEFAVAPKIGSESVEISSRVAFKANKPLADDYVITFTSQNGEVEFDAVKDAKGKTVMITPKQLLDYETEYTVTITSEADDYEYFTRFTTVTEEESQKFEITTTSTTMYNMDRENAIYPAFVDNFKYQSFKEDGQFDYFQLKHVGAVGEVAWEITSGELPTGLTLSKDGKISGMATKEGNFSFSVKATDEIGQVATKTLTMVAKPFRAKWHEDAKFGFMVQWGSFSQPQIKSKADIYKIDERTVNFNADEWAQQIADMGGKVFNFTVVGGDGIRLWPSTTPSTLELKTQRNYVQELIDACHERGIKFIGYLPGGFTWIADRDFAAFGDGSQSTLQYGLFSELIDMGMDGVWVDSNGSINDKTMFDWDVIVPMIRYKNPDFIIGSNPVGTGNGYAVNYPYVDYQVYEGLYTPGNLRVASWSVAPKRMSAEMSALLQADWADMRPLSRETFIPADEIIKNIKDNWANGVTYMAAIVSLTDGTFMTDIARPELEKVGKWVKENIDSPNLFGYNMRKKQIDDVEYGKVSNTAFIADGDMVKETRYGSQSNIDAFAGIEFVSPQHDVTVTHLGRYVVDGNSNTHTIRLVEQAAPLKVLREVELDLSTATVDEDGFAYVEIEPIKLNKNEVYYVLSNEKTTDAYAVPVVSNIKNNYNVIVTSPAWTDVSGTRIYTEFGPGKFAETWPYMQVPETLKGGALTNFKAVVDEFATNEKASSNLAATSYVAMQSRSGAVSDISAGAPFAQYAVDGDVNTYTVAGDGNWAYGLRFDLGAVKHGIEKIVVKYVANSYATNIKVFASKDGVKYENVFNGFNTNPTQATLEFDPVDARYIRVVNQIPSGAYGQADAGFCVITGEVEIYSTNLVVGSKALFMDKNVKNEASVADDLSIASFAIDENTNTVATASKADTVLRIDFGGWKDIYNVTVDTDNEVEIMISPNGQIWEPLGEIDEFVQAKYLLVKSADSNPLSIRDIIVEGEPSEIPPVDVETEPEQPAVGGGGGGSSEPTTPAPSEPAPEVPSIGKPGWAQNSDGTWSYGGEDGKATIGWAKIYGIWYHFDNEGTMNTGWYKDTDGKWYFFDSHGAMATGWVHDGNAWYYMNSAGVMQTGWVMVNSNWYYLNSSGMMVTGWRQIGASWYYMAPNGVMVTGWNLIGGKWYYMHNTGSMAFNQWIESNGKWYYVTSDGSMAVNTTIGGYKVDENGVWVK